MHKAGRHFTFIILIISPIFIFSLTLYVSKQELKAAAELTSTTSARLLPRAALSFSACCSSNSHRRRSEPAAERKHLEQQQKSGEQGSCWDQSEVFTRLLVLFAELFCLFFRRRSIRDAGKKIRLLLPLLQVFPAAAEAPGKQNSC